MISVKDLENKLAKFIYDLETEDRLVRVGLKDKLETAKIYQKYKELYTKQNLDEIKKLIDRSGNEKIRDILKRVYFTIAGNFMGLATAKLHDEITTSYSQAEVKVLGEELAFYDISPKMSKEANFEKREIYDKVGYQVKAKINPRQLALIKEEISLIKKLGFLGYLDYFSKAKSLDYAKFYKVAQKTIAATDKIWEKTIDKVSQEILGRQFKNIKACHLVYLRSLSMFDNFYPVAKVVSSFLQFADDLGFDDLLKRIEIDDKDRPRKNPRAVCYWPKPGLEIHLVIKPIGGEQDFEAIFHEGGHALHGAAVNLALPYALQALAHSHALTETYAFVLEDLVFDPSWLSLALNVSAFSSQKIRWQAIFGNLMMLRRYLGKFSYEYEMFSSAAPADGRNVLSRGPQLYSRNLQRTTGFITNPLNWLSDMDSGFYSADYLRAWIAAAQIKDYLARKFGQKWFLTKKAGKFLRDLWKPGVTYEVEDVIKRLGYKPWDTSFLILSYEEVFQ